MSPRNTIWGEAQVSTLTIFWPHASAVEIAGMLGPQFTKNAVIGKAFRLGLPKIPAAERQRRTSEGRKSDRPADETPCDEPDPQQPAATVTYQGREMPVSEAHRLSGTAIALSVVKQRLGMGWPLMRALTHGLGCRKGSCSVRPLVRD
jgi:hypothetical protein